MIWAVVTVGGLLMETWFIVVLGRQVTERFEESGGADPQLPVVRRP